jgi:heat shock protein HslJ
MRAAITGVLMAAVVATSVVAGACRPPRSATAAAPRAGGATATLAPVTLESLAGRRWALQSWNVGDPAPRTPVVTLEYEAGRFVGRSGCNRYSAALAAGFSADALVLGPVAGTRMMCPEPAMAVESRFLAALPRAKRLGRVGDMLAVVYRLENGGEATMLFAEIRAVAQ